MLGRFSLVPTAPTLNFIKYVEKNRKLPFASKVENFYKNGNAKVKYAPHQYNSYPLHIIKGTHVEDPKKTLYLKTNGLFPASPTSLRSI